MGYNETLRKVYIMPFEIDPQITALNTILAVIAEANDIANKLENLMNENPAEAYGFPTENVLKIVSALRLNAQLASNLFEQNRDIMDQIRDYAKKHNIPFE